MTKFTLYNDLKQKSNELQLLDQHTWTFKFANVFFFSPRTNAENVWSIYLMHCLWSYFWNLECVQCRVQNKDLKMACCFSGSKAILKEWAKQKTNSVGGSEKGCTKLKNFAELNLLNSWIWHFWHLKMTNHKGGVISYVGYVRVLYH